jgi:1-acyl-sn-glycerol-3-phosphate acyltransferase
MSKIYKKTIYYRMLCLSVSTIFKRFFRQIEVRGTSNIPSGEPVIYAANHQNALIDALSILFFQKEPIVFMARADIFQKKIAAIFLRSLKIAPIYRIRDGFENLTKNERQMNEAVNVLFDCKQLCLMPEGNQGNQHKLRPLVKGLFRIAYTAEERLNGNAHVKIIPVGIDYNYYQHAGSDLVITYGSPIEVKDYIKLYKENQANGLNVLRKKLGISISSLMHDIRSTSHYDMIYKLCCYGTPAYLDLLLEKGEETEATTMAGLRFDARCALGKILDKVDSENPNQIIKLDALCLRLKKLPGSPAEISEWMDDKQPKAFSCILMILSVLLIPGFLTNFPVWTLTKEVRKHIEDTQMHSTFAFTLGVLFNAIIYLIVTFIIAHFSDSTALLTLFTFIFITAYGIISERARQALRLPLWQLCNSFGKKKETVNACKNDYTKFKEVIKQLIKVSKQ